MNSNTDNELIKRIVIIGGVAAGASAAARLRRLDEFAQITIIEKGDDVSFANCGLPYYIGGEIEEREKLALQTPESLNALLNIEVKVHHEATSIDLGGKNVKVKNLESGESFELPYDKLILAPGASPLRPSLEGIDDYRILALRTLSDMDQIAELSLKSKRVLVIGAGFIGLEMAEQLRRLEKEVTLVELQGQVLPPLDPEMAKPVENALSANGIEVITGDSVEGFEDRDGALYARLKSGKDIQSDMVLLSIGVKPESHLAKDAGLKLGSRGHVVVNEFQQTSHPDVYAAGDVVETRCAITGGQTIVPLGGPANRQGRVIAEHISNPENALPYPGSLGTAIVRVFDISAGLTGLSEKRLQQQGIAYKKNIISDFNHANYYPGAVPVTIKVLYSSEDFSILGAQVFGSKGVDKRLDVLATAIRGKMTIMDLEHLELSYAPPFGSAKDPVNTVGFASRNQEQGYVELTYDFPDVETEQVLDARPPVMQEQSPLDGAIHIPLAQLRKRMEELDKSRPVVTICKMGKFSYMVARVLMQHGFKVKSYVGGLYMKR
jgi:NADPH-dependent 2,4-dienoyl-CoA reductase/sulfur reductase-like enzyme/rhodanese-related sulfurtransferase